MTQTNPEQWAVELLNNILGEWRSHGIIHACIMLESAFAEREARNLSDTQRLLWRDELGDICPSLDVCFDGSDRVRCGPCAIEAAKAKGVDPDYTLPNLPEVSRLKRENARLVGALEQLYRGYVRTLENGRDRITFLGGECDPVDRMESGDPVLIEARATLAALKDRTHG